MKNSILILFISLVFFTRCREDEIDVNVGLQDRGTVIGKTLINLPYQKEDADFVLISGADIRFTTGGASSISNKETYQATSNSSGEFLIELPAGSYNVYACYRWEPRSQNWAGSGSVLVPRGSIVDMGEINLEWQRAYLCAYF